MTTQSNKQDLNHFLEETHNEGHLRVEADLGDGFVRLRTSEAERRQAAQDIQSSEDIVIEMLRNSRDAGAANIYIALNRDEHRRFITIIDDGSGIPVALHERIFEPRVTSKLDTAHMDKWGMHGRGMALYSVSVNAKKAQVIRSEVGKGSSIGIETDLRSLSEKSDQSSFPRFEVQDNGSHAMRGPKNILRVAAEFALEHRATCHVYCGTFAEIAATLYARGMHLTTPSQRAFGNPDDFACYAELLAYSIDVSEFARTASSLGLTISERTCRRILDGDIKPLPSLLERLQSESFPKGKEAKPALPHNSFDARGLKIAPDDMKEFQDAVAQAFGRLAERYYLEPDVQPHISITQHGMKVLIPIEKQR